VPVDESGSVWTARSTLVNARGPLVSVELIAGRGIVTT